ncbi:hypothetical protein EMPS_00599 [Entomortierella parvispora]|uniref:FAD-binding FR-type domain-containing protein n=1 Tax=Entomortierella parvispora TaxID=205924 RepID=A0A9P3H173_9FUNG|nr:hypothetical protein EMPS_00599 [Entomortierella parvispora]
MRSPRIDPLRAFIFVCLMIPFIWALVEGYITWIYTSEYIFQFNSRDYFVPALCIVPSAIGHLATIWGHYFRTDREFHHSLAKVTAPASVKQRISLWEHHILWGYTVKYWVLVGFIATLNLTWVIVLMITTYKEMLAYSDIKGSVAAAIAMVGGYSAVANCALILFLVLRRSMLHALGFTYSEILPLHRWLGVAIMFWSVVHTIAYLLYYIWDGSFAENFNFYDIGRSTMNLMGFVALFALLTLGLFSIPQIRRLRYTLFMGLHRVMTVLFLLGTIVHYPYFLLAYYLLPSVILFFIDRFVPKMVQAGTLFPKATCTLNADADILRLTLRSPEPMKPYYPGDYIMVQIPELGTLYHPFTIASYWPEDPQSIVLYIRTYGDSKRSWTGALARLCGKDDKKIQIRTNVDGVFGDRRHDYLKSETLVFFVAGAAVTTFMALIKAIAAQITASEEPLRIQVHLICTFRTRSELHAYGSFLHQITRDPRFTTWLHVEIYVSRPNKSTQASLKGGAHAHVIQNDIQVPGPSAIEKKKKKTRFQSLRRTGTKLRRALSGRTVVNEKDGVIVDLSVKEQRPSALEIVSRAATSPVEPASPMPSAHRQHGRSDSIETIVDSPTANTTTKVKIMDEKNMEEEPTSFSSSSSVTRDQTYDSKRLPTFKDADVNDISAAWAKRDLTVTSILIILPLGFWFILRAIHWENADPQHFVCNIMADMSQHMMKVCYSTYPVLPPFGHIIAMSIIGYFAVWLARRTLARSVQTTNHRLNRRDAESGASAKAVDVGHLPYPEFDLEDEALTVEDGNWDEGDVVFSVGRVNVKTVIHRMMGQGIGQSNGKDHRPLVTVFGGGPEAFVEHLERQVKAAKWAVDFHRETWAP